MMTSVLATKLFAPPLRENAVRRPRLIARLQEGIHGKMTLIAAPAGSGKTTLISEWLASYPRPAAWLSLDEADGDPTRLLTYLVAAIQTIAPAVGAGIVGALQSSQPLPAEAVLTSLLNDIAALPEAAMLVLDDYHLVDSQPVDRALIFLLDHLPPQLHLVIATREDPALPLARLRARGQLTEVRAADLRFTLDEAAGFLNHAMGLDLSTAEVATLEERTEGWIAGLQLAALSMQGNPDVPSFIRTFAGNHRYIVDYLLEEVLQRQPADVRNFLLETAILTRLHGPLCDAVTGQARGQAQLEALERGNFLVVPLDDTRQWYRYHHLFAEVLVAELRTEQPELLATLHRRASVWYEQHGAAADAIHHALAAQDFARAADLVELAAPSLSSRRQEAALLDWITSLPDDLVRVRPVLCVAYAHGLLVSGRLDGVEQLLSTAEQWLELAHSSEACSEAVQSMVVVDDEAFRRLPGAIALARAGLALAQGDVSGTTTHAQRAFDLAADDDSLIRGGAAGFLGLASWTRGDLDAAHRVFADAMIRVQDAGNIADAVNGANALAVIRVAQGRLRDAMNTYERGLQLATPPGAPVIRGAADMHVGISEIEREYGDIAAATQHLMRSQELGEHAGFPQYPYRWRIAMARIRESQGALSSALDLLDEAAHLYVRDFFPDVRPIAALKARVWIAQMRLENAVEWANRQGLSAQDDLSYAREFEHITLARLLLARGVRDRDDRIMRDGVELLARLLHAAESGARTGRVLEILLLQALACQAQGNLRAALEPFSRALTLAEPEGYVRMFVDEGQPMLGLLNVAGKHGIAPAYVSRLLVASGTRVDDAPVRQRAHEPIVEPLSARERDVLRLLRTDLSGPDIARELVVSLNTLRTHTKSIYDKLGVNSRRAAVHRAEDLGLF